MHEVAVLERPGEQHPQALCARFELGPVGAEAHDHRSGIDRRAARRSAPAHPCSRSACRSRRPWGHRRRETRPAGPRCPRRACRSLAFPGFGRSRSASARSPASASGSGLRHPRVDVDSRGHGMHPLDRATHLLDDLADVLGAHDHRRGAGQRLGAPRRQLGVAAHRVLELRSVGESPSTARRWPHRLGRRGSRGRRRRCRRAAAHVSPPRWPRPRRPAPRGWCPAPSAPGSPRSGRSRTPAATRRRPAAPWPPRPGRSARDADPARTPSRRGRRCSSAAPARARRCWSRCRSAGSRAR